MAKMLVALCGLSAIFAMLLIVHFALSPSAQSVLRLAACVLLIDQSMMTILYLLAKRLAKPLRLVAIVGGVGILIGGLLLVVQNAVRPDGDPEILITALGAVAIVQGAITVWQIARTGPAEAPR